MPVPGQIPEARVHDHQVRGVVAPTQLLQDVLDVRRVDAREEVEAHQMVTRAELAHLAVVGPVVHGSPPPALQEHVVFEAQLTLALQLAGRQQTVLLEQEHQVLVHGALDGVPQNDDELVMQQLLDFVSSEVGHDGFLKELSDGAPPGEAGKLTEGRWVRSPGGGGAKESELGLLWPEAASAGLPQPTA